MDFLQQITIDRDDSTSGYSGKWFLLSSNFKQNEESQFSFDLKLINDNLGRCYMANCMCIL